MDYVFFFSRQQVQVTGRRGLVFQLWFVLGRRGVKFGVVFIVVRFLGQEQKKYLCGVWRFCKFKFCVGKAQLRIVFVLVVKGSCVFFEQGCRVIMLWFRVFFFCYSLVWFRVQRNYGSQGMRRYYGVYGFDGEEFCELSVVFFRWGGFWGVCIRVQVSYILMFDF